MNRWCYLNWNFLIHPRKMDLDDRVPQKSIIVKLLILVLQTLPVELAVCLMSRLAHHELIASSNDCGVKLRFFSQVPFKRCHEKLHEKQFWTNDSTRRSN